ncbi:hypothetical protein ACFFKE_11405 [Streptomyces mutabilis]|uniref:hypothetical protein n=1 Tax=Streptomyces mutabilis TaxID=67332 RepID=UPI0035EA290B
MVVALEEFPEEACDYARAVVSVQFMAAKAVDVVAGKAQLPVLRHHLGVELWCRFAVD